MSISRTSQLAFNSGEDNVACQILVDSDAGFAYYFTNTTPANVVKVQISDHTRVGVLTLNTDEDAVRSAAIDLTNGFMYAVTRDSGAIAKVIKIKLSDFTRVGALTLNSGETQVWAIVIDEANDTSYVSSAQSPSKIIKIDNNGAGVPTRTGAVTLNTGENNVFSMCIDNTNQFLYAHCDTAPSIVVKVNTAPAGFARDSALTLATNNSAQLGAQIDLSNGFAYFLSGLTTPVITKVDLSDLSEDSTLSLSSGDAPNAAGMVLDTRSECIYIGTEEVTADIKVVTLSSFTVTDTLVLNSGDDYIYSLGLDEANRKLFAASYQAPTRSLLIEGLPIPLPVVVEADFDDRWDVNSTVSLDFDDRWHITETVALDFDDRWNINLTNVPVDFDDRWNINATLAVDFDDRWHLRELVTVDFVDRWHILIFRLDVDFDDRWNIEALNAYLSVHPFDSGTLVYYGIVDKTGAVIQDLTNTGIVEINPKSVLTIPGGITVNNNLSEYGITAEMSGGFQGSIWWLGSYRGKYDFFTESINDYSNSLPAIKQVTDKFIFSGSNLVHTSVQDMSVGAVAEIGAGLTTEQADMLRLMYKMAGLDPTVPLIDQWNASTNTGTRKTANASVVLEMVGDPEASVTTTRTV